MGAIGVRAASVVPARRELLVALGTAGSQGFVYVLNIVASRRLGTAVFGELAAIFTLSLILSIPVLALQQWSGRLVAQHRRSPDTVPDPAPLLVATTSVVSVVSTVLAVVVTLVVAPALNTGRTGACVAVATIVFPLAWLSLGQGVLQGGERLGRLTLALLLAGFARLLGLVPIVLGRHDAWLVVTTIGVASMVAAVVVLSLAGIRPHPGEGRAAPRAVVQIVAATGAIWALGNIDVVLARANLSHHQAGLYAAGALVARAVQWAPQFIAVSAFASFTDVARSTAALRVAATKVGAIVGVAVLASAVVGPLLVPVLLGSAYTPAGRQAWAFALLGGLLALNQLLLVQRIARHDEWAALAIWIATGAFALAVAVLPGLDVADVVGLGCVANGLLGIALVVRVGRRP